MALDTPLGLAQPNDWPLRSLRLARQDFQLAMPRELRGQDTFPPGTVGGGPNFDWPNPVTLRRGNPKQWQYHTNNVALNLRRQDLFPPGLAGGGTAKDLPNPTTARRGDASKWQFHVQASPLNLRSQDGFPPGLVGGVTPRHIENPRPRRLFVQDVGSAPATLFFGTPTRQSDWPNPRTPRFFAHDAGNAPAIMFFGTPAALLDWPNPVQRARIQHEVGLTGILAESETLPFLQADFPNPRVNLAIRHEPGPPSNALYATIAMPVMDWPNPRRPIWITLEPGAPSQLVLVPVPPPIIIDMGDTHDGDRQKKAFDKLRNSNAKRREDLVSAYQQVSGEYPMLANQLVEPFVTDAEADPGISYSTHEIDFNALMRDTERVHQLIRAYQEMDDEEAILLL